MSVESESDDNDLFNIRAASVDVAELRNEMVSNMDKTIHEENARTRIIEHVVLRQRKQDVVVRINDLQRELTEALQMLRFRKTAFTAAHNMVQSAVIVMTYTGVLLVGLNGILVNFGSRASLNESTPNILAETINVPDPDAVNLVVQLCVMVLNMTMGILIAFAKFRKWVDHIATASEMDGKGVHASSQLQKLIMRVGLIYTSADLDRAIAEFVDGDYNIVLNVLSGLNSTGELATRVDHQRKYFELSQKLRKQETHHESVLQDMMTSDATFIAREAAWVQAMLDRRASVESTVPGSASSPSEHQSMLELDLEASAVAVDALRPN